MPKIYYAQDCNLGLLKDKTVAIIGYGSQSTLMHLTFMTAALM